MNELVSVIIPLYNKEKYIKRCIDSLVEQTYKNLEIIIIDDGSTDNSSNIIEQYKDERIKLIQKENEGVSLTRNRGIENSTGKYIAFVDADDYVSEEYIYNLVQQYEMKDIQLATSGYYQTDGESVFSERAFEYCGDIKKIPNEYYILGDCHTVWGKLYLKEIIDVYNIRFRKINISEDSFFNVEYSKFVKNISCMPKKDYYYVQYGNENNLTAKAEFSYFEIYQDLYKEYCKMIKKEVAEQIIYPQYYNLILKIVKQNKIRTIKQNKIINKVYKESMKKILQDHDGVGNEKILIKLMIMKKWRLLKIITKLL